MPELFCKEVCHRCWREHRDEITWRGMTPATSPEDRFDYKKAELACPYPFNGHRLDRTLIRADEPPPSWCPFIFEHAVSIGLQHAL